jgi:hypothetical protein
VAIVVAFLALPAVAFAHLERPSYWPDPRPDNSVVPPAGGEVPDARSLGSAVTGNGPGDVRVVCVGEDGKRSLELLRNSVHKAEKQGYRIRPSQPKKFLSEEKARKLLDINRALAQRCKYSEIQQAVFDSGNSDRVVVMPGRYKEKTSRKELKNDPACASMTQESTGGAQTPSYRYQTKCPNDQNLIHIAGRAVPKTPPPSPPLADRHGIPDEGRCIQCNLQLEGSGVKPVDVIIDAGKGYDGHGPEAKPSGYAKDVILRVDRADGFVGRNFLVRGALEHGLYIEETDGYLLDKVKFFWAADYGNLTFTSDHGLYKNCDGFGSGDSVVYPGAAPETGEQADKSFYPDAPRINTVVKHCDLRGSALAYSGSMGNAVRITKNNIYGNGTGISSDTISASGHPGYPADSSEIDHNYIYSNNLNLFTGDDPEPPVEPVVGVPIGVGTIWPGMNNGNFHDNWIFDNWRYGSLLLSIPDALVTPEGHIDDGVSCPTEGTFSTSCNNRFYDNHMGQPPPDFEFPSALSRFDVPHAKLAASMPNGVDFWWDEAPTAGNCWFDNTGSDGTTASVTGPGTGEPPDTLPSDCGTSQGPGDAAKTAMLLDCSTWGRGDTGDDHPACEWFHMPSEPGSAAAKRDARAWAARAHRYLQTPDAALLRARLEGSDLPVPAAGDAGEAPPSQQGVGDVRVGSVSYLAQCRDWTAGTDAQRLATIADIRSQINTGDPGVQNPTLSDEATAEVFDNACSHDYAAGFRLYKLYFRASAYEPLVAP